jgi:dCMP deaminase
VAVELSTALHAEAAIVASAARDGLPLAGADLYVSTFPCPGCARLVAEAGFRRCYFAGPYSLLGGETVLRAAGVELIWVDLAATSAADGAGTVGADGADGAGRAGASGAGASGAGASGAGASGAGSVGAGGADVVGGP